MRLCGSWRRRSWQKKRTRRQYYFNYIFRETVDNYELSVAFFLFVYLGSGGRGDIEVYVYVCDWIVILVKQPLGRVFRM